MVIFRLLLCYGKKGIVVKLLREKLNLKVERSIVLVIICFVYEGVLIKL